MVRSLIIIALAIVCGAAAAIGVNQTLRHKPEPTVVVPETQTVIVAAVRIGRGQKLTSEMLREVQWPKQLELSPNEVIGSKNEAAGRVALASMIAGEPVLNSRLTDESGKGFIASIIEPGMRAYTIQTRGPSATVAGLVRPEDRVDVLVNIRGNTNDETGGSRTTTLLESVKILAIDQILDPDAGGIQQLEMWTKGDDLTSVTLEVSPDQASLLALGQSYGELSLSLRCFGDEIELNPQPATIHDIQNLDRFLKITGQVVPDVGTGREAQRASMLDAPPDTYIQIYRGSIPSRIDLVR